MKKLSLVIKILCLNVALLIFGSSNATSWRINNAGTSNATFSSIQLANDDVKVASGDTLFVEGSATEYASATIDKRLVIIGPGYFLNENPMTSLDGTTAIITNFIWFDSGSEGSILIGLTFGNSGVSEPAPYITVDDITISRCYLPYGIELDGNSKGHFILNNYFNELEDYNVFSLDYGSDPSISGVVFKGNIVNSDFEVQNSSALITFASVENNLFLGNVDVITSTYRNNIWLPLESATIKVISGIKEYNLNITVDMGAENNNSVITNSSELYSGEGSTDGKWQIKEDSAYKNTGKDGTDPGPFGGSNPYVLSGLPALPIIYEISTTGFGSTEEGLPVSIKVRSN